MYPPHPHIVEPVEPGEPKSPEPAPDTNREILEVGNTTPFDSLPNKNKNQETIV